MPDLGRGGSNPLVRTRKKRRFWPPKGEAGNAVFLLGTPTGTPDRRKAGMFTAVKKTPRTVIGVTERG